MTREEAIARIKEHMLIHKMNEPRAIHISEALVMAIKALELEPCEDTISRQAVVKYIKASDAELGHDSENEIVVEDILNMPPVTPVACIATVKFSKEDMQELVNEKMKDIVVKRKKGKWIPVSERLPMGFEFVNCTCHSLIDDREDWVVETVYIPQPSDSPYSDWGNIPMLNNGKCEVIAWMHRNIPEPYKAESED